MQKLICYLILLLLLSMNCNKEEEQKTITVEEPSITFEKTFGGAYVDIGFSVQQTKDEGYIIVGYTDSKGAGKLDVYLIKTDKEGNRLWEKTFGGTDKDEGSSVQQTKDEGYIIAGRTKAKGPGDYDVYLIKTDKEGNKLWEKTYSGASSIDEGYSVQQTKDEGYIIAGYTGYWLADEANVYLIKTDEMGNKLWEKTYGGVSIDEGYFVQQTKDEGYIITGRTKSKGVDVYDVYLIKTDKEGNKLWEKTFGGTNDDRGKSVQQTKDEGYIIAGYTMSKGAGGADVYLIKTDKEGNTLWEKTFGEASYDCGKSVQETKDEGYIIVGWTKSIRMHTGGYDVYLIKIDKEGNTLWEKTFGGVSYDAGYFVQQTKDEGYIIAGLTESWGAGKADVYLIKTDKQGNVK